VDDGEFQLVETETELVELLGMGRVTSTTPLYAVGDGPRTIREIPELAHLMSKVVSSEPAIRRHRRSPERAMLSEELAILNRPLEDEVEYYDETPSRRWPKRVAFVTAFAAAVIGAHLFAVPQSSAWRSLAVSRLIRPARGAVASSVPETASRPTVPVGDASPENSLALEALAVGPKRAAPRIPDPRTPTDNRAASSAVPENTAVVQEQNHRARGAERHRASRALRRHPPGNSVASRH
jgi:hypothetical protein